MFDTHRININKVTFCSIPTSTFKIKKKQQIGLLAEIGKVELRNKKKFWCFI